MEIKKNKSADNNQARSNFFMIGFLYVSSLILAGFNFEVKDKQGDSQNNNSSEEKDKTFISRPKEKEPEKEPEIKQQAPQPIDLTADIIKIENKPEDLGPPPPPPPDPETEEGIPDDPVEEFPDVEAQFKGGEAAMQRWMQENLEYPEISMEMGEQGKVYLKFVVEKDGNITSVEVIKGISRDLDNEAKRLVRAMPLWQPGETRGLKVRSSFTMPINFELN
ncbi:MAG: energy transducer TonB [Bacteroidetes bacterium]|nr:energy transducer TonB [Bacteroidota bacterium]